MFPSNTKSTSFSSALGPIYYISDYLNLWYTYIQSMCIPIVYASIHWFRSTPTCCISLDIDSTELRFIVWAAVRGWWQNIFCAEMKNLESVGIVCNMLPCLLDMPSTVHISWDHAPSICFPRDAPLSAWQPSFPSRMHLWGHRTRVFKHKCIHSIKTVTDTKWILSVEYQAMTHLWGHRTRVFRYSSGQSIRTTFL